VPVRVDGWGGHGAGRSWRRVGQGSRVVARHRREGRALQAAVAVELPARAEEERTLRVEAATGIVIVVRLGDQRLTRADGLGIGARSPQRQYGVPRGNAM